MTSFPKTKAEAACLAFLRAVNTAEADTFGMMAVPNFDGVAIEHTNDMATELTGKGSVGKQEREEDGPEAAHGPYASRLVTPW